MHASVHEFTQDDDSDFRKAPKIDGKRKQYSGPKDTGKSEKFSARNTASMK
jgi:hypothetical protein